MSPTAAPISQPQGSAISSSSSSGTNAAQSQPKPTVFEFTRRKRWVDLLVNELTDSMILVLSPKATVWFCSHGITELLGWRDVELIDTALSEFVNGHDYAKFEREFATSIQTETEMSFYLRFRKKNEYLHENQENNRSDQEVLFEFTGYPHFIPGDNDCKCFFAMARPCPGRNAAALNAFSELKMDNERLQQRLRSLRAQATQATIRSTTTSIDASRYSFPPYSVSSMPEVSSSTYYRPQTYDSVLDPSSTLLERTQYTGFRGVGTNSIGRGGTAGVEEDSLEDGGKKKKIKKSHLPEQHVCVTCGRTDSPEWRKGPLGPKTLCNACGLRWAKQQRKSDGDGVEGGVGSNETPNTQQEQEYDPSITSGPYSSFEGL